MKFLYNKLAFFVLLFILAENLLAQNVFGPQGPNYIREIIKTGTENGTGPVVSYIQLLSGTCIIGKSTVSNETNFGRALIQWNIPDNIIPDNSTIDNVRLYLTYTKNNHSFELDAQFSSLPLDIQNLTQSQNEQLWQLMSTTGIGAKSGVNNVLDFVSNNPNDDFNLAVKNALVNDRFVLGIRVSVPLNIPERTWTIQNPSITLRIEFTPPSQTVTVAQKLLNNTSVDSVGLWNLTQNKFDKYAVPKTFVWDVGSSKTLQGSQKLLSNEKYKHWEVNSQEDNNVVNHKTFPIIPTTSNLTSRLNPTQPGITIKNSLEGSSTNGGQIEFRDPWFIDYSDPAFGNQLRNRGMNDAIYYQRPAPFNPTNSGQYKGVFLNQDYNIPGNPYYKVGMLTEQTISINGQNRKFFPYKWRNDGGVTFQDEYARQTGVVFTSSDAKATAILKGQLMSNDQNAYANNSQRKFVRTDDGILHNVYSSMGRVWYETSTDNGVTWLLANSGQPLDNGEGKLPSIDYSIYYGGNEDYYQVFIVFQEKYGSTSKIKVKYFRSVGGGGPYFPFNEAEVGSVQGSYYSTNTTPVIGVHSNYFTVVWKRTGDLYAWAGHINISGVIALDSENALTGTAAYSINPTISFSKTFYSHKKLAWEEEDAAGSVIKYATLNSSGQISGSITIPSNGSGFTFNYSPSIIQFMDASRLCWVGYRWISDPKQEEDGFPQTRVLFKAPESAQGRFWQFGNYVSGPSINRKTGDDTYYAFAWYESSGQSKFADNTLSTVRTISDVTGQNLQISNGPNKENMFCMSFDHNVDVPYFFEMSENLGSFYTMEKILYYAFTSGREGVVSVDSAEFYFALGDLEIDGEPVDFKEIADTIPISDLSVLNEYLISEPFNVSDNSSFIYSVQYGINDSASGANAMIENRFINFKIKLTDDNTGEIIGEFDNVTYNSENIYQYNNISYQVNTQGIGNRTVRLKLVVDNNFNPNYSMSKIYSDESILAKTNVKEINFNGSALITSYDLFQNYPNPFNPITIIKYQIPKSGNVSLKVYDILGSEIATLVNEFKNEGRYEVSFDASILSSGIYIYRLNVNDYVSVKKMVLLK